VLEAEELLKESHSWDALKRALRGDRIRIEPPGDGGTPGSVDPEPIPLDVKVVLVGEPYFYYQLHETDGEFAELFKVGAEFGETMRRDQATELAYARFAATIVQREGLLPLGREAVAAVIEHSSRLAEDAGLLSADFLSVTDLLREADYWARSLGRPAIDAVDVDHAIKARERMADRVREELHDSVRRGILQIDTQGSRSGVVNGLVIVGQGDFEFALPSRISASVRMGGGEVLDIEREVDLSGPLHSKGVLVLAGFLGGRYVPDTPLAMSASLTFEQSHQPVDGDSASVAELVAILSALAEVPVRQDIAVTGSISQDGTVQAVGGVDTKIEGFHDVCALGGLTGSQGVAVPRANVQQLMLRQDVIDAAAQGRFHVYAVDHLDELVPLLTGLEPGARGTDGTYPEGTFNRKVEDRLAELAEKRREKGHGPDEEEDLDPDEGASGRRRPRRKTEDRRRPRGQ
jgi:predicted ATP-dependent protease